MTLAASAPQPVAFWRDKYGFERALDVGRLPGRDGFITGKSPHRLYFHEFLFVAGGSAEVSVDDRQFNLTSGSLLFCPLGSVRQWHSFAVDGWCLLFEPHFVTKESLGRQAEVHRLEEGAQSFFVADLETIGRFLVDPSAKAEAFLRSRVESLLAWLSLRPASHPDAQPPPPLHPICGRFLALVEAEYFNHPTIATLCARLGVSQRHLAHLMRQHLATTPLSHLHDRIALEALRMLKFSGLSVSQIGYRLGFNTPEQFSRFIRRETGTPPARLRARLRPPV